MSTSSSVATYSSKTIRSIFRGEMVESCAIRFAFQANLSTLSVATGDYVAGRSAEYENQA